MTQPTTRRAWYLGTGLVFALHNLEEGIAAPRLLAFMPSRAPQALRAFYEGVTAAELRFSLTVLTVAGIVLTIAAARTASKSRWAYAMLVFACVIGLNAIAHIAMSGIFGAYVPGLITAILLTLPVGVIALVRGWRERWISRSVFWTVFVAAALVHGPALVLFIRATIGGFRTVTGSA